MAKLNIRNRNKDKFDKNGKAKPPNWEYRFEAAPIDGKRKSITKSGFKTKKEAEIAGAKAMAEYDDAGLSFKPSETSYSDYLDYWFENFVKMTCKYNTQNTYKGIIENHVKPALGHYRLRSLTPMIIQEFVNKKFVSGLKKTTLMGIMAIITSSLKYAVVPAQMIKASPAEYITYPKVNGTRSERNRYVITQQDFERITERFDNTTPHHLAVMIGYYTGLRIGEVYALTWDDIDFENGLLSVNKLVYKRNLGVTVREANKKKAKKEEKSAWYFGDPKTKGSTRTVKIGATLMNTLRFYRKKQMENQLLYGEYYTQTYMRKEVDEKGNTIFRIVEVEKLVPTSLPQVNLIMRNENGQYSSTDSFKYASRVINYDLGIQFNFHSLRHTHATKLIEAGVTPKSVQSRLGHSDIKTTLQTYTHSTEQMDQQAVDVFEQITAPKVKPAKKA